MHIPDPINKMYAGTALRVPKDRNLMQISKNLGKGHYPGTRAVFP